MGTELYGYAGKRVVVVGGATGMGAATARLAVELGAEVTVLDYAEVTDRAVRGFRLDLRDQAGIEAVVEECGTIDVLFSCAGVANGAAGLDLVNFAGQRHLVERFVSRGQLLPGGAVGVISSVAGLGWENNYDLLRRYLDTPDFAAAAAWMQEHRDLNTYAFSKQAMCAYVARQAFPMLKAGLRINSIMPGPTDTPLSRANTAWLQFAQDYRDETGTKLSTPEEQASVLIFLGSAAASQVNGVNLLVDAGYVSAGSTGAFSAPAVKAMLGRVG